MSTTWRDINPEEEIRKLAYRIWERRINFSLPGTPEGDWREAEWKLRLFPPYVAVAAYFIWQGRQKTGTPGTPEEDWINAQKLMCCGVAEFQSSSAHCGA